MSKITFYDIKSETKSDSFGLKDLENSQQLEELIKSSKKLVLDIYADWCSPCKYVAPKFEELSKNKNYSEIQFAKINLNNLSQSQILAFKVTALPAFLFFNNTEYLGKENGANIENIKTAINIYFSKNE